MQGTLLRPLAISSLSLLVAIGSAAGYFATRSYSSSAIHPAAPSRDAIKEIAGYRSWTKVNSEPQLMPDRTAVLCAAPLPAAPRNPHLQKYLTVYINEIGRKAMPEQFKPAFPEGSVIVKEKLADKSAQTPELLTVMIKRGNGFNPASGDWEYIVVDGAGTTVQARGKLENCQSCHTGRKGTDYVFRTYLPREVLNQLK